MENKKTSSFVVWLLFFSLGLSSTAKTDGDGDFKDLKEIEVKQSLDPRFPRIQEEAQQQRLTTGGVMLALGSASIAGALISPLFTNPTPSQSYPLTFGIIGGILSIGGFYVLAQPSREEILAESYSEMPDTRIDSSSDKAKEGTAYIEEIGKRAFRRRVFGGLGLAAAGLSQVAVAFSGGSFMRSDLTWGGYAFSAAGTYFLVADKNLWIGGPLAAVGIAHTINGMFDPSAPSSDYLLITGGFLVATGALRFLIPDRSEKEQEEFDQSKISFDFNPRQGGGLVSLAASF